MKNLSLIGIITIAVISTGYVLSSKPDQETKEQSTYEIYYVDGEVEKVKSYPMYLESSGCVHLVDNQRFPKYCFVKKLILVK